MKRPLKKKLEDFIKDESGNISKDKALKIGLGTISALGIMSAFSSQFAEAKHRSINHGTGNDPYDTKDITDPNSQCLHASYTSHSSY